MMMMTMKKMKMMLHLLRPLKMLNRKKKLLLQYKNLLSHKVGLLLLNKQQVNLKANLHPDKMIKFVNLNNFGQLCLLSTVTRSLGTK